MHGKQRSWFPAITVTQTSGGGFSLDGTFNVGVASYTGNAADITRDMLVTNSAKGDIPTGWVSGGPTGGPKLAFTGTVTYLKSGEFIIGKQLNFGAGVPAGPVPANFSIGASNTWLIRDYYPREK